MRRTWAVWMVSALLAVAMPARAEHVTVDMPDGWPVTKLDAPQMDGEAVAGTRHRAMLPGMGGRPLAAIELLELPQTRDNTDKLGPMMQAALKQAAADFTAHGLDDICDPPQPVLVAARPGLRAECTVRRGTELLLRQAIVMWVTPKGLYSLSYSAGSGGYAAHEADFTRSVGSARIE